MVDPLPLNQITSLWNPSPRRTWQTCQPSCNACYCASRAMNTFSVTALVRKWPCLTPFLASVHVLAPDIPLDIAIHHAHLSADWKEAFQHALMSDAEMCALTDIIITG